MLCVYLCKPVSRLFNESKLLMGQISDLKPFTGSGAVPARPRIRVLRVRGKGESIPPFFVVKKAVYLELHLCLECPNKSWGGGSVAQAQFEMVRGAQ